MARVRADVFVFCVQTQQDPASYDMLDLSHWQFWVADALTIGGLRARTIGIGWVRKHAKGPLAHGELAAAIHQAAQPRSAPQGAGAPAAGARSGKRPQASLDDMLHRAGADVVAVAGQLRELADQLGLAVVTEGMSLRLCDQLGPWPFFTPPTTAWSSR